MRKRPPIEPRTTTDNQLHNQQRGRGGAVSGVGAAAVVTTDNVTIHRNVGGDLEVVPSGIDTTELADGAVTANKLASDAVTTAKIANSQVTNAKLADGAVTNAKITDATIIGGKIAGGQIADYHLDATGVSTGEGLRKEASGWDYVPLVSQDELTTALAAVGNMKLRLAAVPSSDTVTNTTTETAFSTIHAIEAGLLTPNDLIVVEAGGMLSSTSAAPTMRWRLKFGTTTLIDTTALTVNNYTNVPWSLRVRIICATSGSPGTAVALAEFQIGQVGAGYIITLNSGTTPPSITTSSSQNISLTAQWSAASTSNIVTLQQLVVMFAAT